MKFINTRPQPRAAALTELLQQHHFPVIELPLLELTPCPYSEGLQSQFQQLLTADVIVVVSPIAVHVGMQYLRLAGLSPQQLQEKHWVAVGQTTAQALADHQIQSAVPELETSEGMLSLPILQQLDTGRKIAFWRGEGGRQFMMSQLLEQGHTILNMLLYTRACPDSTVLNFAELALGLQHEQMIVLITSEASWLHWLQLMDQQKITFSRCEYWVLGTRLQQLLFEYRQQNGLLFSVKCVENLKAQTILQHMQALKGCS